MSAIYTHSLNRGRFETWTTRPEFDFHQVKQTHSPDIVSIETLPCEADGIFISWEDFSRPIAIKTADCMPIVIEGEKGAVFLHAGWRGLADGILRRPEISFIQPKKAYIGPSIHKCCFEVSSDFKNNFKGTEYFFEEGGKYYFDLQAEACDQLKNIQVEISSECTACNSKYHSYRRDKTTERNWNFYIKG